MSMLPPSSPNDPTTFTPSLPADDQDSTPAIGGRFGQAHHILLLFLAAVLLIWILSGFYRVNANELAIVERLGQFVGNDGKATIIEPGSHYALPWPIDKVYRVPVQETRILKLNYFNASPDSYQDYKQKLIGEGVRRELLAAIFEPYVITADKNIVHIELAIKYQITNPQTWLTTVAHQGIDGQTDNRDEIFQMIASHVLIQTVARTRVDNILFAGSERLPLILTDEIKKAMKLGHPSNPLPLDPLTKSQVELGINIQQVEIVVKRPPAIVEAEFKAVADSRAEKQVTINTAISYGDTIKTRAAAERDVSLRNAEIYKNQIVEAARGEAQRFSQILAQYQNAPDIIRQRLYADTAQEVLSKAKRIFWVAPGQKTVINIDPPTFDPNQINTPR